MLKIGVFCSSLCKHPHERGWELTPVGKPIAIGAAISMIALVGLILGSVFPVGASAFLALRIGYAVAVGTTAIGIVAAHCLKKPTVILYMSALD